MEVSLDEILFNENNPRTDMGDLEKFAESFTDGEPFIPPIVARDGSKFRLFDGERRVRAMQLIGTERCLVNVYPTFQAAEAAVAAMATDMKKPLSATEQARGFQTMLEYDLSDEDMRRATGLEAEKVQSVRRVLSGYAGDKQTTLDAIFEADRFEDPDERMRVLEAGPNAYHVAQEIRWEHSNAKKIQKLRAAIRRCGVPDYQIIDEPKTKETDTKEMGLDFLGYVRAPKDASTLLDGYDTMTAHALLSTSSYNAEYVVYISEEEHQNNPQEARKRRNKAALAQLEEWMAQARSSALSWYVAAYEQKGAKFTRINTKVCKARAQIEDLDEGLAAMVGVCTPSMYEVAAWIGRCIRTRAFSTSYPDYDIRVGSNWNWDAADAAAAWSLLQKAGWQPPEGIPCELRAALNNQAVLDQLVEDMTREQG